MWKEMKLLIRIFVQQSQSYTCMINNCLAFYHLLSAVDEMYLASLINKGREVFANGTTDPTVFPAEKILRMLTINGAKSVLWDNEIGSLEVGKKVRLPS